MAPVHIQQSSGSPDGATRAKNASSSLGMARRRPERRGGWLPCKAGHPFRLISYRYAALITAGLRHRPSVAQLVSMAGLGQHLRLHWPAIGRAGDPEGSQDRYLLRQLQGDELLNRRRPSGDHVLELLRLQAEPGEYRR